MRIGMGIGERLAAAGATDFLAIPFRVDDDPDAVERPRAFLAGRARTAR